jgi:hypothetical protein
VQNCGVPSQLRQVLLQLAQLGGKIEVVRTVLLIGADLHRQLSEGRTMQEVLDRARLVDASDIGAREIRTTVRRDEIQDVLKSKDGDPELVIDVTRGGETEARTMRFAWDPGELEKLLQQTDGDNVTLVFDASELERAFEDDVTAHGLRQAALVLAVAATTAASGAAISQAALAPGIDGSSGGPAASAQVSQREWPVGVDKAAMSGTADQSTAPAAANKQVVSQREWPVGVDKAAVDSSAIVSQREWPVGVSGTPAASPSDTSATTSTSPGTDAGTAAAIAGGAALLIVAAGFSVRRHRKVEPKPV